MTVSNPSPAVLLVGGGLGIGANTTEYILASHPSARIVVFGLHISQSITTLATQYAGRLWIVHGDAAKAEDRTKAKEVALEKMGKVDALIVTMGIMGEIARVGGEPGLSEEGLRRVLEVNVMSPILMAQLVIPSLRQTKGRIIILSSAVDKTVQYAGWTGYCTSKAALSRAIEVLAHEEKDIHVLGVYPGLTRTSMIDDILGGKFKGIMFDEEMERFRRWESSGTKGIEPPEWCAAAVGKLALGEAKGGESGAVGYYYQFVPDGNIHAES